MSSYKLGQETALKLLRLYKNANESNPLIQGAKVETEAKKEMPAPVAPVWSPPPHATSGTVLNPKVAAEAPPAYQPALTSKRCDTCGAYELRKCVTYDVSVEPNYTCATWHTKQ